VHRDAPLQTLAPRFSRLRRLGEGGFGVVYEAHDDRFGDVVAVKLLRRDHASAIYRFKREFRSLADVVHPNLVRLYELVADEHALYFTMELVDGTDLLGHVCGGSRTVARTVTTELPAAPARHTNGRIATDATKLRSGFVQLANGVQALHDAHKLHCDIKPSNVLVARDGRVVLLDFGLVAELDGGDQRRAAIGTPGYCAPEQLEGGALTFAADWYSVGAVLHEALTGRLPIAGERCANDNPEVADLAALCSELVAVDPAARPTGPEVVRRLGGGTPAKRTPAPRLIGRERELEALRDAWTACRSGCPVLMRVVGTSGLGKTTLVEQFFDEIGDDALVLRGRCYEQESVPYKALDTVVDALAEHLRQLADPGALLPPNASLLARMFPVLRDTLRAPAEPDGGDSQEQRRRAFLALRELLHRIGTRQPIVCFLDDLQWGDVDSARLLFEILRPPDAPRMLVIGSYRPDASTGFLDAFGENVLAIDDRRIDLAELSHDASRALAGALLGNDEGAAAISKEAAGNPLFIQQLAARATESRAAHTTLGLADVIISRVRELTGPAQRLVETVALAGQPIDEAVAIRAATLDGAASRPASLSIRHSKLIVARTSGDSIVLEPAHDRIREALVRAMPAPETRSAHRRIAEALLALTRPDPDTLVRHFRGAGDDARTREYALLAAERADSALAFERAAEYYKLILELTPADAPDRWQLLERHAGALANAGRAGEAAESFEAAADVLESSGRADLVLAHRRRAGELTLRSGRIALGTQRMERVLRSVGVKLPRSRSTAGLLSATRRVRAFVRGFEARVEAQTSTSTLARLDALFSVATGIAMPNHIVADAIHLQHMREALDAGDRSHVIRALGQEATFQAVIGGSWLRKRYMRMLDSIDALAAKDGDPFHRAWARMARGVVAWFGGDWVTTWREIDGAIDGYRACRGVAWELALCNAYRLPALAYLGEVAKLSEIVPRAYANARELGDLFAANTLRLGQQSLVRLAEDRPEDAIAEADAAIAPFPREAYLGPHYHHLFAVVQAALYRGRANEAWSAVDAAWRELERARFLMAQCLRVEIRHLRARTALALAADEPKRAKRLHAIALGDAAKIAGDDVGPAAPFAAMIRAGVAHGRGDAAGTVVALEQAAAGFDAAHMKLYAHAARHRLGTLVDGSRGAEARETAETWMAGQGIRRPDTMLAMLAPGLA
jgi:tetratricopeptide (TPR) repeat protein